MTAESAEEQHRWWRRRLRCRDQKPSDYLVSLICHQIAAMADHHFLIEKTSSADSTISNIRPLEREESIQELARMLGGCQDYRYCATKCKEMKEMADAVR